MSPPREEGQHSIGPSHERTWKSQQKNQDSQEESHDQEHTDKRRLYRLATDHRIRGKHRVENRDP